MSVEPAKGLAEPARQLIHWVCLVLFCHVPGEQGVQLADPATGATKPGAQDTQVSIDVAPSTLLAVPTGHAFPTMSFTRAWETPAVLDQYPCATGVHLGVWGGGGCQLAAPPRRWTPAFRLTHPRHR